MHALRTDDDAVAPVIGVILMVAITVLLASTAAVFFIGFSDDSDSTPQTAIEFEYEPGTSDEVTLSHQTGDSLEPEDLTVVINDASPNKANGRYDVETTFGVSTTLTAGSQITISESSLSVGKDIDFSEATIILAWEDSDGSGSTELSDWTGPDA